MCKKHYVYISLHLIKSFFIPGTRTSHYGLKQIKSQGPKIWNSIPPIIRVDTSYAKFSNDLKKFFIAKIDN